MKHVRKELWDGIFYLAFFYLVAALLIRYYKNKENEPVRTEIQTVGDTISPTDQGCYMIVVGLYSNEETAIEEARRYHAMGSKRPFIYEYDGKFRVVFGRYETREDADQLKRALNNAGEDAFIVTLKPTSI